MNTNILTVAAVGLVAGLVGAALSAALLGGRTAEPQAASAAAGPRVGASAAKATDDEARDAFAAMRADSDAAEFATLNRRLDLLETELASLRAEQARQAAPSSLDVASAAPTPEAVAEIQREAIVQVLEDQRKAEAEKREAERKERARKAADEMAARTAKELGLGAGDERRLADFYVVAGEKRDEMFRPMRESGTFDRDAMRQGFEDYRTWAETELSSSFGADLGGQILEYQRKQRDSFGGFGGGFGGPPGGGSGGSSGASGFQGRGGRGG